MVERSLAKAEVAGSSPVSRSILYPESFSDAAPWPSGKARVCKTLIPGSIPSVASLEELRERSRRSFFGAPGGAAKKLPILRTGSFDILILFYGPLLYGTVVFLVLFLIITHLI